MKFDIKLFMLPQKRKWVITITGIVFIMSSQLLTQLNMGEWGMAVTPLFAMLMFGWIMLCKHYFWYRYVNHGNNRLYRRSYMKKALKDFEANGASGELDHPTKEGYE